MAWRLAKCLEQLREQINEKAPKRSKASDGSIGDTAHQAVPSDHNPNKFGVVTAIDVTHDPKGGFSGEAFANSLVASRDPRIKYVIWNYKIVSRTVNPWQWRPYTGSNPHNHHVHISVEGDYDNERPWQFDLTPLQGEPVTPVKKQPLLKQGDEGSEVKKLQKLLKVDADGIFGPKTKEAVVAFQRKNNLVPDGIVGTYTWEKLKG